MVRAGAGDLRVEHELAIVRLHGRGEVLRPGDELVTVDGKRVALFLDYDGTLRELVRDPAAAAPTPQVREVLDRLALRCGENLDVTIISGRTPDGEQRDRGTRHWLPR